MKQSPQTPLRPPSRSDVQLFTSDTSKVGKPLCVTPMTFQTSFKTVRPNIGHPRVEFIDY